MSTKIMTWAAKEEGIATLCGLRLDPNTRPGVEKLLGTIHFHGGRQATVVMKWSDPDFYWLPHEGDSRGWLVADEILSEEDMDVARGLIRGVRQVLNGEGAEAVIQDEWACCLERLAEDAGLKDDPSDGTVREHAVTARRFAAHLWEKGVGPTEWNWESEDHFASEWLEFAKIRGRS